MFDCFSLGKLKPRIVYLPSKNYTSTQAPTNGACQVAPPIITLEHSCTLARFNRLALLFFKEKKWMETAASAATRILYMTIPSVGPLWWSDIVVCINPAGFLVIIGIGRLSPASPYS